MWNVMWEYLGKSPNTTLYTAEKAQSSTNKETNYCPIAGNLHAFKCMSVVCR